MSRTTMRQPWRLLACALLLGAVGAPRADVFVSRDAQGNPVFSDRPSTSGATPLKLPPTNSMTPPPPAPARAAATPVTPGPVDTVNYRHLEILSPAAESTLRGTAGDLQVRLASEPDLAEGHFYRLTLDGNPAGQPQRTVDFMLDNLDRGSHRLQASIVDETGRELARSTPINIHVHRLTLSQRRRLQPCQPEDWGRRIECPLADRPQPPRDLPWVPFF